MNVTVHKNYLLTVLLVISAFNNVDGWALGLLSQAIKVDLHLSDTQLGFISGLAVALFYSVMGVPIARWADCGNRVTIIAITTALWSAAVSLCATAGTFLQLLLIRIGVGVGEAGCLPTANSLIADSFTRAERPRAVAIFMMGGPLSVMVGYGLAGWLNQFYGWRATFLMIGLPGLGLAALVWFSLKDPRAKRAEAESIRQPPPACVSPTASAALRRASPGLLEVCASLWANTTFRQLLFSYSIVSFFGIGVAQWQPSFLIRSYGLKTGELGTWFAVIYGLGGAAGTYLGGELASRWAAKNERLQFRVIAAAYSSFGVISVCVYLSSNLYLSLGLMGVAAVGFAMTTAPLFATIQTLVPGRMRAMSIATLSLFANLTGLGLGPLAVGALSDLLRPTVGQESLRYALLAMSPGYIWGGWHIWQASKTVIRDLADFDALPDGDGRNAPLDTVAETPAG